MMYVVSAWRDSLRLLFTRSGWLLLLVTLKTIGYTYKTWFIYWGWIIGLLIGGFMLGITQLELADGDFADALIDFVPMMATEMIYWLAFMTIILAVRPSVARKNYAYYLGYAKHILYAALVMMIIGHAISFIDYIFSENYILQGSLRALCTPLAIFFMLFLFDSKGSFDWVISSLKHAFRMLAYTLPLVVIITVLLGILQGLLFQGESWLLMRMGLLQQTADGSIEGDMSGYFIIWITELLLLPIWVSAFSNIYVKNLYDHMERYFGR